MNDKKEIVDLVILLNGNYMVLSNMDKSRIDETNKWLMSVIKTAKTTKEHEGEAVSFNGYFFYPDQVLGWYFRQPPENLQAKSIKLLEKITSEVDGGETWKNEE